jgi:hypothetical protein
MDPPSKCFTKLVHKNTIKPENIFTTTIYPTPRNLAKSLMDPPPGPPPVFSNRVHRTCYDRVLNSDVYRYRRAKTSITFNKLIKR